MIWLKVIHLVFVVSWFAGLFYLPRIFVYHAESSHQETRETFKTMERRLYFGIMVPAMLLTLITGLWMILAYAWSAYQGSYWLHTKIALAVGLVGDHHWLGFLMKRFQKDQNRYSSRFYRLINEIPLIFLVSMIALVLIKPF